MNETLKGESQALRGAVGSSLQRGSSPTLFQSVGYSLGHLQKSLV